MDELKEPTPKPARQAPTRGLVVDSAWLKRQGYSTQLQHLYVMRGWLEQPTRGVFRRPARYELGWQQVVISLQGILNYSPLVVGGRHSARIARVRPLPAASDDPCSSLRSPKSPPYWLDQLPLSVKFVYHSDRRLSKS